MIRLAITALFLLVVGLIGEPSQPTPDTSVHVDQLAASMPATVTLVTAETAAARSIIQTFVWTDTSRLSDTSVFVASLLLNDSQSSTRGPGVWLDRASGYEPVVEFPSSHYIESRAYDADYHLRFGVGIFNMNQIVANQPYTITWTTVPGDAMIDNADWHLLQARTLFPSCRLAICVLQQVRCSVNVEDFGIDPIPGIHIIPKREFGRCISLNFLLPLIRRE